MLPALTSSKRNVLKFIRYTTNGIFSCHDLTGIKYLTRLRLGISTLMNINFTNNFQDTLKPLCTCGSSDVENAYHFFLHYPNFLTGRNTFLDKSAFLDSNILNQTDATVTKTLLFGNLKYSNEVNLQILNAIVEFI